MNYAPVLGLVGAGLASLDAFKWMLGGFLLLMIGLWVYNTRSTRNALDSRALKDLVKSAAQWNLRSSQDSNAIVGLMNANYAMAYLNVARSLGSDSDIEKMTRIQLDPFIDEIEASQTNAIRRITNSCQSLTSGLPLEYTTWKKLPK